MNEIEGNFGRNNCLEIFTEGMYLYKFNIRNNNIKN